MFNSFDGTKSAIEMWRSPMPPGCMRRMARVSTLRSRRPAEGPATACRRRVLHQRGQVEVISSLNRDGTPVYRDLRWGVYVVFAGGSEYVERCFAEYGLVTDPSGQYAALTSRFT
jgi:hypothetical protein